MSHTGRKITKTDMLAAYQVFGGIFGLAITIYLVTGIRQFNILLIGILLIAIVLYIFSLRCGILLFRNLKKGLNLSRINLLLQVFGCSIGGFAFRYVSGFDISITLDLTDSFKLAFNAGPSSWHMLINGDPSQSYISINMVAILLIIFIEKQLRMLKEEDEAATYEIEGDAVQH